MQRVELNALFGHIQKVADEWKYVEGSRTPLHIYESGGHPAKLVRFPLAKKWPSTGVVVSGCIH